MKSLSDLRMHEAGSGWNKFATLFSFNAADRLMAAMLKAIVDQNKIMIRQNELILRALNRNKDNSKN